MPISSVNGLDLCYEVHGEGEPLLMIMGFTAPLIWWPDELVEMLVDLGFRVIRYDARDVGKSSRLDHLGRPPLKRNMLRWALNRPICAPYTMSDMAADAAGLLDLLDIDRAHVVGVSMGGLVSQRLAIEHPERVRSLTLMMTWAGNRLNSIPHPRALFALMGPRPRTAEEAVETMLEFYSVVRGGGFEADEDYLRDLAIRSFERSQEPPGVQRQFVSILATPDNRRELQQLEIPALVIHGTNDPLVRPGGGRLLARHIPGSRFMLFDGMGHRMPRPLWPSFASAIGDLAGVHPLR